MIALHYTQQYRSLRANSIFYFPRVYDNNETFCEEFKKDDKFNNLVLKRGFPILNSDGLLYHNNWLGTPEETLRRSILYKLNEGTEIEHMRVKKTIAKINSKFYWKKMKDTITH